MKTFLTLLKTSLNVNFGISALKYRFTKEKKRLWEPILIGLSAVIGIGTLVAMFSVFMYLVFLGGMQINKPEMVLTVSVVAGQLLILFFGILYVMSSFYFSQDLNILIPLPLKPSHVLGSKFAVVMVNEYLTLLPMLLPAILIYGIGTGKGILYWLKGLVIFLAAPAIPLVIAAILIMILMRFINIRKSKDLLAVVGGLFSIVAAFGINFFTQRIPKGQEEKLIENLLTSQSGIIEMIGQKFPPSIWATYALSRPGWEGIGYLALFIGLSVLLFAVLLWLGNQIFYKSVLSGQEISRKRKTLSKKDLDKKYSNASNPVTAIFWREWKLFLRTPVYAMNGIVGMVIAPFLLIMPFIANENMNSQEIFSFIQNPEYILPISLGGLAFMLMTSSINIIASTSISREGQMFWISKMIPVSPRDQVAAKIIHGVAVELIGVVITGIAFAFITKMSVVRLLVIFILSIIGTIALVALNLMIDVSRPKLEWKNPQEAVKSNMNGLLGMIVTFLAFGILGAAAVIMILFGLPHWLVYLLLGILMSVLAVSVIIGLFALAEYKYAHIEV